MLLRGNSIYPSHCAVKRESANCEDFANRDEEVSGEEDLHFPGLALALLNRDCVYEMIIPSPDSGFLNF